jgi:DNA-binding NarL/FixJ family response regulator
MKTVALSVFHDNYLLLESLISALGNFNDLTIHGAYKNNTETISGITSNRPSVLLLHIQSQSGVLHKDEGNQESGLKVLEYIALNNIETKVIVISNVQDPLTIKQIIDMGVSSYLQKNVSVNILKIAIDEVYNGGTFFPRDIKKIIEDLSTDPTCTAIRLSKREKEVLHLVAHGYSTLGIAQALSLGKETISDYRESLMKKFRAKNAPDLVRLSFEWRVL